METESQIVVIFRDSMQFRPHRLDDSRIRRRREDCLVAYATGLTSIPMRCSCLTKSREFGRQTTAGTNWKTRKSAKPGDYVRHRFDKHVLSRSIRQWISERKERQRTNPRSAGHGSHSHLRPSSDYRDRGNGEERGSKQES